MIICKTNIEFAKMLFAFFCTITKNKSNNLQLKFFIFFIRTFVYNEQIMIKFLIF